ncbi:MAG: hypothetical protein M1820_004569 [Bogoriella megaspora]|nr:MAG: hypothetical protein M1820_004569 [Bogoriella megaspora]
MAGTPNRMSTYSIASAPSQQPSAQVSTTTLLNSLHNTYSSADRQPLQLEPSTSLVVNTWKTALDVGPDGRYGGTVDVELARKAWEHARRRAEDGCIVLGSLHDSAPSLLAPFVSALPLSVPASFYTALNAIRPFVTCVTPFNPSQSRYSSLGATLTLNLAGELAGASLGLSTSGLDTKGGLISIPASAGYRAFDVFYYLLTSASTPAEREFLGLKGPSAYTLLRRSDTYSPPSFLPTADDAASAEDFRENLRSIGIKGAAQRNLLSVLTGLLKLGDTLGFLVDEDVLETVCEDVAGLLNLDPEVLMKKCDTVDREVLVGALYEALVDWVISKANTAIRSELRRGGPIPNSSEPSRSGAATPRTDEDEGDTVSITVVDIPSQDLGRAIALRTVFDDTVGINAEMKEDGVEVAPAGHSVLNEMKAAVSSREADLGILNGPSGRDREIEHDRRQGVLEKVATEIEDDSFLQKLIYPVDGEGILVGKTGRFDLPILLASSRVWFQLCLHPTDDAPISLANSTTPSWSAASVSRQLRAWRLPEWANRRNKNLDFTADFDIEEFCTRYSRLGCQEGREGVETWIMEHGWSNGEVVVGHERIWIRENAWWEAENLLDSAQEMQQGSGLGGFGDGATPGGYSVMSHGPGNGSGFFGQPYQDSPQSSRENLLRQSSMGGARSALGARSLAPTNAQTMRSASGGDYGLGSKGDDKYKSVTYYGDLDPEMGEKNQIIEEPVTTGRRMWVALVWALTFWIPSPALKWIGRMKRPDVRMAWREKLVLVALIFLLNGVIVFWIIGFGRLLCPNYDKAWSNNEVATHQGGDDFWVSVHGKVYDISKFWKTDHSDTSSMVTSSTTMQPFAGMNLDEYFPVPLTIGCPGLVTDDSVWLQANNTPALSNGIHYSGPFRQSDPGTKLHDIDWYPNTFLPGIKEYYKGDLVQDAKNVSAEGENGGHQWVIINDNVYDLTDYFHTKNVQKNVKTYAFLGEDVEDLITNNPGGDITKDWNDKLNSTMATNALNCFNNVFYVGKKDFRKSAKCQVNGYILLAFAIVLFVVIGTKFLAALQLGSKRRPAQQDKFVICQVPAYTEGEDQLRKGLDSLTSLTYDNKRKLICVICDGMIVGGGNDRPTPKIVLDILGVDPKIDPPALPMRSVGQGSEQLNYGKVYSGLYEYEGNVVPYLVVVKVGKESEQSKAKPGNRGKRDSQILLMRFLNRVHHRAPMSPLELEMFHQINNIIGVDPELYEYMLMVDADTSVKEDSLNRLVANCSNDSKIAGICGETSLENEERSWWTMIQVYEYYISHHLAKAFESLFGSVTCLPGCFCMYRLRTADKGRPLIISDKVIDEYSDGRLDTLHKKNLLALGEDRYLTTLMTKHFPNMSYKFVPDAYALTAAPDTWSVLLSQRRRWINSTLHNLAELVFLKDLCGFCCFSMRFVVFIDLTGTLILPATCVYLGYIIYVAISHTGQFPIVSLAMLAAVYGLQAIIFIIKRQWQHVGWMIIYIIAFPIYSFVLPIYSFWNQDNFSWGNTRVVLGEKGNKQVVAVADDEGFDPRSIPLQRWDEYATANNLPGRRGWDTHGTVTPNEKSGYYNYNEESYEMDDMRSMYSSVKPASTILTGFGGPHMTTTTPNPYQPPTSQSPAPFQGMQRHSTYSALSGMGSPGEHQRLMSMGNMSDQALNRPSVMMNNHPQPHHHHSQSFDMLPQSGTQSRLSRSPLGTNNNNSSSHLPRSMTPTGIPPRPQSTSNLSAFQSGMYQGSAPGTLGGGQGAGPTDAMITEAVRECLKEVDLDTVTKKQLRALAEQRLQCQVQGERRAHLDGVIDWELANM